MRKQIQIVARHADEVEVQVALDSWEARPGTPISDSIAGAIAAWWQSPGLVGHTLASLASGVEVLAEDVKRDILATIAEADGRATDRELLALYDWCDCLARVE